jgi:hypothetical protein
MDLLDIALFAANCWCSYKVWEYLDDKFDTRNSARNELIVMMGTFAAFFTPLLIVVFIILPAIHG